MEDRKATLLAFGVGSLAIGGFWVARPTGLHGSLRIVEQRNLPPQGVGLDDDAAVAIRVRRPSEQTESSTDSLFYRIVDRQGQVYPLTPMIEPGFIGSLKLPRGYPTVIEEPRIQAILNGEVVAVEPIKPLPGPNKTELRPTSSPALSLVFHDGWLEARPKIAIPKNERWRIRAIRTPYTDIRSVTASLPNRMSRHPSSWLRIPYEGRAEMVEVEVTRYRLKEWTDVVHIPGFNLIKRFGSTALLVDQARVIPTRLGMSLRVPKQYMGPYRIGRHPDSRMAGAAVTLDFGDALPKSEDSFPDHFGSIEILSPQPKELGLRELRIGPGVLRSKISNDMHLKTGPFSVTARVKTYEPILIDRSTCVLRVEKQASTGTAFDRFGLLGGRG
jgi:hypothetical protein